MEYPGVIVKLDRGFPLVKTNSGELTRCEHATAIVKGEDVRAVIGDHVTVELPEGHDKGIIREIAPRRTTFVRKDPAEHTAGQVLAANFDLVLVVESIVQLNWNRLERELVLAHETGARVAVILTKADLCDDVSRIRRKASDLAGSSVAVVDSALHDERSIDEVRGLLGCGEIGILIGKSGVGKSSLVNALAGRDVQGTASVRERDGKGRHTTVDRVMVELPNGSAVVDMPGVRGLGLWDADRGLGAAFPDVESFAQSCRFRDCSHGNEPGCAVQAAVESGEIAQVRLESYRSLRAEIESVRERRAEADRLRGRKASDRKKR